MKYSKKIHVPSGTFICDRAKPVVFHAFLSSCVGVAAYDEKSRIGGLSHFLLPNPVSQCREGDEIKYASTGLPLFLNTLEAMGASMDKLKVIIAGGAFSNSISHHDINLDIGGRTADTVKEILRGKNIHVVRSETGGFFTCCLKLDMMDGKMDIIPAIQDDPDSCCDIILPSSAEIDSVMEHIQPIPQIALKILRMINEDQSNLGTLATEVKKDQVISAQVLKYCNSAIFSGSSRFDSIEDAIVIIGQTRLAKLVTTIAIKQIFDSHTHGYSLVKGGLYHHALGVALLSEKLAIKSGITFPFSAYSAGLLHDIGKIILDQFVAKSAPMFYRDLQNRTNGMIDLENKYFRTDHTVTGRILAEKWSLPERVTDTITYHHTPEKNPNEPGTVEIVSLADLLLHMFKAGPELTKVDVSHFCYLMEKSGFKVTDFDKIVDLIPITILTSAPESIL